MVGIGLIKEVPGDPNYAIRGHRDLGMIRPVVVVAGADPHIRPPTLAAIGRFGKINRLVEAQCILVALVRPDDITLIAPDDQIRRLNRRPIQAGIGDCLVAIDENGPGIDSAASAESTNEQAKDQQQPTNA